MTKKLCPKTMCVHGLQLNIYILKQQFPSMPKESEPHRIIKELIERKLQEWFGASITEYLSAGHELDVFAVTSSGISIYVEVIWYHSKAHFLSDMNMLQQSDADIKVVIGSLEVVSDQNMIREFAKVVISQRRAGKIIHGDMLNGMRILEDSEYVENDLKKLFEQLENEARLFLSPAILQIVDLKAVRSKWVSDNFYNIVGKILCRGQKVVKRLNARLEFEGQTPARYVSVSNRGKVHALDWKKLNFSWSPDGTDRDNTRGEFSEMRQGDSIFVVFPDAVGWGYGFINRGSLHWWKNFFQLAPGSSYKFKLVVNGISDSLTVTTEKTIEFTA